jgi:hypothetical protein
MVGFPRLQGRLLIGVNGRADAVDVDVFTPVNLLEVSLMAALRRIGEHGVIIVVYLSVLLKVDHS